MRPPPLDPLNLNRYHGCMFKKVAYVVAVLAIMTIGIFLILRLGYERQPIGIMKPSSFDTAENIGAAVYRRFYVPIEEQKIVVFGIPPQPAFHRDIIRGFLEAASEEKRPFDLIITEAEMPILNLQGLPDPEIKPMRINTESQAEFIEALDAARAAGRRTLVYMPSVYSSHLLSGNVINRFETNTKQTLFTITSAPLALRQDQEYVVEPVCVGSEVDGQGLAPLGCAIMRAGRSVYRKKLAQEKWVAMMNDQAREDYLLLVSTPGQDKANRPAATPPAKAPSRF